MDAALKKALGELLLNAVPTIVMFAILYVAYRYLVHDPLMRILADRHEKTAGAVAKAKADIAAAEAKTADFETRMREARMSIFKAQEARRKQLLEALSSAIAQARQVAEQRVKAGKADIEKEAVSAKAGLQAQTESLAADIIHAVLGTGSSAQSPAAGAKS